ncbi:hypothetical protein V1505DRAFT_201231 [Lipomyces doorenjongii]
MSYAVPPVLRFHDLTRLQVKLLFLLCAGSRAAHRCDFETTLLRSSTTVDFILAPVLAVLSGFHQQHLLDSLHYYSHRRHHNYLECIHRFLGWTAIVLFWASLFVSTGSTAHAQGRPYAVCLYKSAAFWWLLHITLLIVYPWRLRKGHVRPEILSSHAIRLHFDYALVALCQGIRISTRPLLEWHSFATIPESSADNGFSLIVSKAGDWTSTKTSPNLDPVARQFTAFYGSPQYLIE